MRFHLPLTLLVAATLIGRPGHAQTLTLAKDIYPGIASSPSQEMSLDGVLGTSGGRAYVHGRSELGLGPWVVDLASGEIRPLLDVDASRAPGADVNGTFFFSTSGPEGAWLCRTDGTVEGTSFVRRFAGDGTHRVSLTRLTKVGSLLLFVADDRVAPPSLWKSDGTETGTSLVKTLPPGAFSDSYLPAEFVDIDGTLLFSCNGTSSCGLWRSDGTEAGTVPLTGSGSPAALVEMNGTLFFRSSDPAHGPELWKSDGTPAGTALVRDIVSGSAGSSPRSLVSFGGLLFFALGSDGSVWKSDGTEAGTVPIGAPVSDRLLVPSGARLFFTHSGAELYATDGTGSGTALVRAFDAPVDLSNAVAIPGALLFWVDRDAGGLELWRTDGTAEGTAAVKTIGPGNVDQFSVASVSGAGGALLFVANNADSPFRSDGTPAGTAPAVAPSFRPNDAFPRWLTDAGGALLFSAFDAEHGNELWRSDGTSEGTVPVRDLEPGPGGSGPSAFFPARSTVFFRACVAATGCELYRTDGTADGTRLVKDIRPGPESSVAAPIATLGDGVVLQADDGVDGREVWWSDGTDGGTYLLADLNPGPGSSEVVAVGILNGELHFCASIGAERTLWKTDGTASGTLALGPVPAVGTGEEIGGALVFPASDPVLGEGLWKTDGTSAGTGPLAGINPVAGFPAHSFLRLGPRLVFRADDGVHGLEPWVTDGTAAGTGLLKDLHPGPLGSLGTGAALLGGTLFFFADDGVHGFEPWKTDGTPDGTVLVRDIAPGSAGSSVDLESFVAGGHEVFFTASDHVSGRELWRSDGTAPGTTRVADLLPGIRGGPARWPHIYSRPHLARSGGRVFLMATDGTTGYELWSLPVPTLFHPVVPCRVADTRNPEGPSGGPSLAPGTERSFPFAGRCGIPSTAVSVATNVTVVSPSASGSLAISAGGPVVSGAAEVPLAQGKIRAYGLVLGLGTSGTLSVRASLPEGASTDVVFDVTGYFE